MENNLKERKKNTDGQMGGDAGRVEIFSPTSHNMLDRKRKIGQQPPWGLSYMNATPPSYYKNFHLGLNQWLRQ